MPVHDATTSAMSSAPTSSLSIAPLGLQRDELRPRRSASSASSVGDAAVAQLGRRPKSPSRSAPLSSPPQPLELLLGRGDLGDVVLLQAPPLGQRGQLLALSASSLRSRVEPLDGGRVGLLRQRHLLDLEPAHGALELVDLDRPGVDLHAQPGGGLVDQVDRLVGQEPVGDVAVGQGGGGDQRGVGDPDAVVHLVALLEAAQDADGVLDRRLADHDRLEPPLQRRVLLDVLAVFVQRGRADHPQLAAGEHRLEHVAGVHRALALAGADHGVQLVEERDDLPVGVLDLLEDGLEPLLELAAVLRAGDHRAEVERDELLVAQRLGHVAGHDPLGQALDDRGLADAGLADQHRVVLGPAGQHLHDPADLGVAADHRVDLAVAGTRGQVDAVLLQRLVGLLGVGGGDPPVAATDGRERGDEGLLGGARRLEHVGDGAADPGQAGEQVLGGDVLVAERAGDLLGRADGVDELAGQAGLGDARALRGGQALDRAGGGAADVGRVGADGAQQRRPRSSRRCRAATAAGATARRWRGRAGRRSRPRR